MALTNLDEQLLPKIRENAAFVQNIAKRSYDDVDFDFSPIYEDAVGNRRKREVDARSRSHKDDPHHRGEQENSDVSQEQSPYSDCVHPEYLVYSWVLSLIALATTMKLYFLIKTSLAIAMVLVYALFILIFYPEVFANVHLHES